ncbi:trans-acting enoyl reductase family protein [soil metagenome]
MVHGSRAQQPGRLFLMPDVLLFGATGYTGRLTAHALAGRGVSFAIAGRRRDRLDAVARATGHPEARLADADPRALVRHLHDVKVLVTCAGPFAEVGRAAVDAALEAGVHYIDSSGESSFIDWMIRERSALARSRGVVLAPALGFEEVPAGVAATIACADLIRPHLRLTLALPSVASPGTMRSALGVLTSAGRGMRDGRPRAIAAGRSVRWAPMPPPLGPRRAAGWPLAEGVLAPLHLSVDDLELYVTTGRLFRRAAAAASGALRPIVAVPRMRRLLTALGNRLVDRPGEGPEEHDRFTILAEARSDEAWRHVTVTGRGPYELTANLLAAGAERMASEGYGAGAGGVIAPVEAVDLATWVKELRGAGVVIEVLSSSGSERI